MKELYPMGAITFAIACACCKHNGKDTDPERCYRCKAEKESGFTVGKFSQIGKRWIPVTERLPENWIDTETAELVNYLVYGPYIGVEIGSYHAKANRWIFCGMPVDVTHWMPLPEAPEVE